MVCTPGVSDDGSSLLSSSDLIMARRMTSAASAEMDAPDSTSLDSVPAWLLLLGWEMPFGTEACTLLAVNLSCLNNTNTCTNTTAAPSVQFK